MDGPNLPARVEPIAPHEMELLPKEKDALRIQAAAVVAQQAALTEVETKLNQRETALQRQEEQLAAHLESKRSQIVALQEQVGEARTALRRERDTFDDQAKKLLADIERDRSATAAVQEQAQRERKRFVELRRRLKQRWRRHWAVQDAEMHRREQALEAEWRRLADEADRVQRDRNDQIEERLRFSGEVELGRRQLQDDRAQLAQLQQAWAERRASEQHEVRSQFERLTEREKLLAQIERDLFADRQEWEARRLHLEREIEGLENRARNQRQKLIEQQEAVARLNTRVHDIQADTDSTAEVPQAELSQIVPARFPACEHRPHTHNDESDLDRLTLLERVAGDLADQRLQLAEQFGRLVQAEQSWRQAHVETIGQWEALALHLQERERSISARERSQQHAESEIRQRREELSSGRCQLDACRARLTMREAAWESERATLLAQVQAGEELTKSQIAALDDLRRKWKQRRREQTSELQNAHAQFIEARRLYASLWEDCLRRSAAMDQEKRTLAEKTLALEQYRLEEIGQAENAASAERKLERLRRRCVALFAEADRALARERQALQAEIERVETRSRQVEQQAASLASRHTDQMEQQTEWENHQQFVDDANIRLRKELDILHFERAQQDRQLAALRTEVEAMAHTLLEQGEPLNRPTSQAA